jgi:hypothetical protein
LQERRVHPPFVHSATGWSSGGTGGTMDAGRIGEPMETRAHTHTPPPRQVLRSLALLLALLLCGCLAAAAAARPARTRPASSCHTSHRAKHSASKRCSKHHPTHKAKKPAPKAAVPAPKLTSASCEDGTAPVRVASGDYNCTDGSEPACEDGSDPILPSATSAPMCHVTHEECAAGSKAECGLELVCEEEATEGPQGCEHGSALEEEGEEPEG